MKLNEVPTELLKESLLAIADLRRKYQGEAQVTKYAGQGGVYSCAPDRCPLCRFHKAHKLRFLNTVGDWDECACPWYWIEGHHCEEWVDQNNDDELRSFDDFPIPDRLKRIDRWESAINAEIANREAV